MAGGPGCRADGRGVGSWFVKTAVLLIALAGLTACSGGSGSVTPAQSSPDTSGVVGDVRVDASTASVLAKHVAIGDPCTSGEGFEDLHQGTQVVIADESGRTIALGSLDAGTIAGRPGQQVFTLDCSFAFEVPDVPTGHPFYRVSVGRRGSQQFSAEEIQRRLHLVLS